jgi:RNA polymerase sigma factor (sigma-70 family)
MTFDADFLANLRRRDPATSTWFVFTFTPILEAKLRYKFRDHSAIEDMVNETFCRVLIQVDKNAVRDAAQFGSFVRGVCDNVAKEWIRRNGAAVGWPEALEPTDRAPAIDELLADKELKRLLRIEIGKLTPEKAKLITDHLQGRDRRELARERGITSSGYNVKLHRALKDLITEFRRNQI